MTPPDRFDDVLEDALHAVTSGVPLTDVLRRYPLEAKDLQPLLRDAMAIHSRAVLKGVPVSERLEAKGATLLAAVRRERLAHMPRLRDGAPWWGRRLAIASVSAPAGLAAIFLLAGIGGAAAATTVAIRRESPVAVIRDTVDRAAQQLQDSANDTKQQPPVAPPSSTASPSGADNRTNPATTNGEPAERTDARSAAPAASATAHRSDAERSELPDAGTRAATSVPAPVSTSRSGTIHDVHGNAFTLTTSDGDVHVTTDNNTRVHGSISDGRSARVSGVLAADKNLLADRIDVTGEASASSDASDSPPATTATAVPTATGTSRDGSEQSPGDAGDKDQGPKPGHKAPATSIPSDSRSDER